MPKRRVVKKPATPKVKRVRLTPEVVLVVEAPKGIMPVMVPHPEKNAVEIVPVPVKVPGRRSWWSVFGGREKGVYKKTQVAGS